MPARATPFSAIGSCALAAYITYLGLVENFALVVMGDGLRFIHSPFNAPAEVIQLGLLAIVTLVACSFTFGLSEPIYTLPSGLPVKLPVVHFPGGKLAFAWRGLSSCNTERPTSTCGDALDRCNPSG